MVKHGFYRLFLTALLVCLTAAAMADPILTTPYWLNQAGEVTINGMPAPIGTVIDAFDPDGVNCGRDTSRIVGIFGYMSVYGDDNNTPGVDEGCLPGDLVTFRVMGVPATIDSGRHTYQNQDTATVFLSVSATIGLEIATPPPPQVGQPADTVRITIGVHNTGDITDLYGVAVLSAKGWPILAQSASFYNEPDSVTDVWFDVAVPALPGGPMDTLTYTVFSMLDPSVSATDSVTLDVTPLDVEDDPDGLLPTGFTLNQNYPNPFNPTTTVSFSLTRRSGVRLEVFDLLGRQVAAENLGSLAAGDHEVEFDGSDLASGVYFYRVVTDLGSQSRKMVLMK